ncbi:hypothetical protein [Streptomyces sp. NPDC048419]|uniref:hypothetical protein n=1 Tax=Streptomyces sp. NPDC048419 TaxID=3365547 RepID=UPI0037152B36
MIVYPPDSQGGRRVRFDGAILGRAFRLEDVADFLRRAGMEGIDEFDVMDADWVEWRAAGRSGGGGDRSDLRIRFAGRSSGCFLVPSVSGGDHRGDAPEGTVAWHLGAVDFRTDKGRIRTYAKSKVQEKAQSNQLKKNL